MLTATPGQTLLGPESGLLEGSHCRKGPFLPQPGVSADAVEVLLTKMKAPLLSEAALLTKDRLPLESGLQDGECVCVCARRGDQGGRRRAAACSWSRVCRRGVAHKFCLHQGGPGHPGFQLMEATKALEIIQANG